MSISKRFDRLAKEKREKKRHKEDSLQFNYKFSIKIGDMNMLTIFE